MWISLNTWRSVTIRKMSLLQLCSRHLQCSQSLAHPWMVPVQSSHVVLRTWSGPGNAGELASQKRLSTSDRWELTGHYFMFQAPWGHSEVCSPYGLGVALVGLSLRCPKCLNHSLTHYSLACFPPCIAFPLPHGASCDHFQNNLSPPDLWTQVSFWSIKTNIL